MGMGCPTKGGRRRTLEDNGKGETQIITFIGFEPYKSLGRPQRTPFRRRAPGKLGRCRAIGKGLDTRSIFLSFHQTNDILQPNRLRRPNDYLLKQGCVQTFHGTGLMRPVAHIMSWLVDNISLLFRKIHFGYLILKLDMKKPDRF